MGLLALTVLPRLHATQALLWSFWGAGGVLLAAAYAAFSGWGREDSDLVIRLLRAGVRRDLWTAVAPDIDVASGRQRTVARETINALIISGHLVRLSIVSAGFLREANRVTYWLGLPALLFSQLAGSFHQAGGAGLMFTVMLAATGTPPRSRAARTACATERRLPMP